jgi:hypothetical protein
MSIHIENQALFSWFIKVNRLEGDFDYEISEEKKDWEKHVELMKKRKKEKLTDLLKCYLQSNIFACSKDTIYVYKNSPRRVFKNGIINTFRSFLSFYNELTPSYIFECKEDRR